MAIEFISSKHVDFENLDESIPLQTNISVDPRKLGIDTPSHEWIIAAKIMWQWAKAYMSFCEAEYKIDVDYRERCRIIELEELHDKLLYIGQAFRHAEKLDRVGNLRDKLEWLRDYGREGRELTAVLSKDSTDYSFTWQIIEGRQELPLEEQTIVASGGLIYSYGQNEWSIHG